MNYLIFRTDRIGDFLLIRSLLKAIKENNDKNKIFIVASKNTYEFIKKTNLVDKIFLYSNGIIVRNVSNYSLENCLRVSIGTASDCEKVIENLTRFQEKKYALL